MRCPFFALHLAMAQVAGRPNPHSPRPLDSNPSFGVFSLRIFQFEIRPTAVPGCQQAANPSESITGQMRECGSLLSAVPSKKCAMPESSEQQIGIRTTTCCLGAAA